MNQICFNGSFFDSTHPVLLAANRSYRYGDGFFETIKVAHGKILFASYHKKRIENSISLLQYKCPPHFSIDQCFDETLELCKKNQCLRSARVRLSFFNGNGALDEEDQEMNYLIEAASFNEERYTINSHGLVTGIFTEIKKSCGTYSNIKASSALIYSIAARFAAKRKWNDSIILNQKENICESSIANIFWMKENRVYTPSLTEGCVSGVMRLYLIDQIGSVTETHCRVEDILHADEVFLTNALRGIRWVQSMDGIIYKNEQCEKLYQQYIVSL